MPDGDIVRKIDELFRAQPAEWRVALVQVYRDELNRRSQDKATRSMLEWTRQVRNLTVVILVLTIVNVVVAFCNG
jgi:hypothetical protein